MVQQVLFSHSLGQRQAEVERSTQTLMHQHSVCAPAPTPRVSAAPRTPQPCRGGRRKQHCLR
ncbi:hypothetical protein T492DRAFT_966126, partial [Pavlovales sp. CCMP2436]